MKNPYFFLPRPAMAHTPSSARVVRMGSWPVGGWVGGCVSMILIILFEVVHYFWNSIMYMVFDMDPTHFAKLSLFFFEILTNFLPNLIRCYSWKLKILLSWDMGLIIFLIRSKFKTTHEENGLKIIFGSRLPIRITFKKIHSQKIRLTILQSK